jgi:chemotaxis protein histidine kinase CheA
MSLRDSEQSKAIRDWASRLRTKPAKTVLGPIEDLVHRLADRLEKQVNLEVSGDDLRVDAHKMRPVLQSLTHLVRNALDHGIEPPDLRGDKPAVGTLRIEIVEEEDVYHVVVGDDGRGVDVNAVVQKAIERGYLTEEQANVLSPQERLNLMFVDGVSTASHATEVSGRGVGMGAVYGAVLEAGGGVRVSNAPGQGTRFHVRIPKPTSTGAT